MRIKYELNLDLYEVCVTLLNYGRWNGLFKLQSFIVSQEDRVSASQFALLKYGIELVCFGRDPDMVDFFLNEYVEDSLASYRSDSDFMRDVRLIFKFVGWIQNSDTLSHTDLLFALDDRLRSKYYDWAQLNEYDNSLTFKKSTLLSLDEIHNIRESNLLVKNYYDQKYMGNA